MATETKDQTPKETKGAKSKSAAKGEVRVEVLTRIRVGRAKDADGRPGKPEYVEEGEEMTMPIDEADKAETRGIVKILEGRKAREAAKAAE